MRWVAHAKDEIRIRKHFAWFPVKIDDETRWLETVYVKQRYTFSWSYCEWYWDDIEFVNRADYLNWKAEKKNNGD